MRHLLCILSFLLIGVLSAQSTYTSNINNALANGDAQKLQAFFSENVSIEINGNEKIYSRKQAESMVSSFFQKNKPKAFDVKHESEPNKTGNNFNIGILRTENGAFRLTYLLKDGNQDNPKIRKIKLVKIVR